MMRYIIKKNEHKKWHDVKVKVKLRSKVYDGIKCSEDTLNDEWQWWIIISTSKS